MIKITRKILLILTTITIATALLSLSACNNLTDISEILDTFEVVKGDIIQTVNTSGYVDSVIQNEYSLLASGKVIFTLEKGDTFGKDDMLIEIDSIRQELLITQAEENLEIAENSLELARISYRQALDANHIALQLADINTSLSEESAKSALTALEDANEYVDLAEEEALSLTC